MHIVLLTNMAWNEVAWSLFQDAQRLPTAEIEGN
jgi:hypothetical protein